MKIVRSDPERLVIVDFPYVLGGIFTLATFIGGGFYTAAFLNPATKQHDLLWGAVLLGVGILVSILLFKRSVFDFDLALRQLAWKRLSFLGVKGGRLSFSEIKSALVQTNSSGDGGKTYRVTLITNASNIPLTTTYSSGNEHICQEVTDAINRALGAHAAPALSGTTDIQLRVMVKQGMLIEAIKLVREQRHCGLAEAKQFVAEIQREVRTGN